MSKENWERFTWKEYFIERETNFLRIGRLQNWKRWEAGLSAGYSSVYKEQMRKRIVFNCDWLLNTYIPIKVVALIELIYV